jgi:hypothetical protein
LLYGSAYFALCDRRGKRLPDRLALTWPPPFAENRAMTSKQTDRKHVKDSSESKGQRALTIFKPAKVSVATDDDWKRYCEGRLRQFSHLR